MSLVLWVSGFSGTAACPGNATSRTARGNTCYLNAVTQVWLSLSFAGGHCVRCCDYRRSVAGDDNALAAGTDDKNLMQNVRTIETIARVETSRIII